MSGIYIHIPFCKQACHYCDFHFSTTLKNRDSIVKALGRELELRKDEFKHTNVETIYFGGGTPSVLTINELQFLIDSVYKNYNVSNNPEITLEANPDDLIVISKLNTNSTLRGLNVGKVPEKSVFKQYQEMGINRLSIGVQSFLDKDLKLMNRAHNAKDAKACLTEATKYFSNISIDLIYGIQGASNANWIKNIEMALAYNIPHISSYALTIEPNTALASFIKKGLVKDVNDEQAEAQFSILKERLEAQGYIHYEISNFSKEGFFSKNNSAYWQGKPYIGIGPSAHSFNGKQRSWNVRNNLKYNKAIAQNRRPATIETLTKTDQYNEYVMTGLRTIWGVSLAKVHNDYGIAFKDHLIKESKALINKHLLYIEDQYLHVTKEGQFLTDGIASQLFILN